MPSPSRLRLRACAAGLCLAGAAGLVMASETTVWAEDTLLSTSGFVAAMEPLPADPAVEKQIGEQVERRLSDAVGRVPGIGPRLVDDAQVRRMVAEAVPALVDSAAFERAWKAALRTSHTELVNTLRDDGSLMTLTPGGLDVTVHVAVEQLGGKAGLPDPLVSVLASELDLSFTLVQNHTMHRAAQAVRLTDVLSGVLVPATVGLGLAGLLLARRRFRALTAALAAVAAATGTARLIIAWAQTSAASRPVVADVAVRRLTEPLADGLVTVMGVSAVAVAGLVAVGVIVSRSGGGSIGRLAFR
ncbi:hypothetical protein [Streptomyces daliensis]|uniref:Integral membrane protein n=1 Tax=Streptomyces daliensis TaxID=299421 RepID=A0A8T4IJS6_9ACTN|nr:hypothetical protein [Streptomyces daliensis]